MGNRDAVRVAVVGQIPPPMSGQFVMVSEILDELSADSGIDLVHIPFRFTKSPDDQGAKRVGKLAEVLMTWMRTIRAAWNSRFDVTLYPVGGTGISAVLRDVLTMPIFLATSRKVVLHFHAGGHASSRWDRAMSLHGMAGAIYRRADLAIVMTPFNRRDPEAVGISRIEVVPHRLPDNFDATSLARGGPETQVLYIGHVRPEKGFPELLEAFAGVAKGIPNLRLTIAGEILPPFSQETLLVRAQRLGIDDRLRFLGAVSGDAKWRAFAEADIAVFPTRAGSETFGLVLVEAMMWKLPLVTSDWRGNREVTGEVGTILFPVRDDFSAEMERALNEAIRSRLSWEEWGTANRSRYLANFSREAEGPALVDVLFDLAH